MNGGVLPVLAMFIVAAEESGVSSKKLSGTIQSERRAEDWALVVVAGTPTLPSNQMTS